MNACPLPAMYMYKYHQTHCSDYTIACVVLSCRRLYHSMCRIIVLSCRRLYHSMCLIILQASLKGHGYPRATLRLTTGGNYVQTFIDGPGSGTIRDDLCFYHKFSGTCTFLHGKFRAAIIARAIMVSNITSVLKQDP